MTKNVKSEIQNTGFADILCDEAIHRDDNHIGRMKIIVG